MKAWHIQKYGGPEVLQFGNLPEPAVADNDVLVQIKAASINPIDWKMRDGMMRMILKQKFPLILGNDLSGVVTATGKNVSRFSIGDEVFARPDKHSIGALAERIAVAEDEVAIKPPSLDFEHAAALPLVGLTSLQALTDHARLRAGQKVLIHAGAGGVGTFAIQYARHLGAYIATTASVAKHELVKSLGADEVIDYRTEDFSEVLADFDVVFDTLGGSELKKSVKVLKPGGIIVSVSGPPGPEFAREWSLSLPMRWVVGLMSLGIRRRAKAADVTYRFFIMHASGEQLDTISALVENGTLKPVVDRVFDFEHADEAIAYAEAGHATGKVIVRGT